MHEALLIDRAVDGTFLCFQIANIERRRNLIRSFYADCSGCGTGGALTIVLCDSGLGKPSFRTQNTEIALHILNHEDVVRVVEVSSGSGCLRTYSRMNESCLVQLSL